MTAFGLGTFGDVTVDADGRPVSPAQTIRDVVEQAVLADALGVDAIALGEHHREEFAVSAPEIVLAAIAARTERILLATGVTVLSSDDAVRVYERFATLDAVSSGRAEVQLGRGSFTESFPLFGLDLAQYEELFEEKLDLFSRLLEEGAITWQGKLRAPLIDQQVYPKTEAGRLRTWIGVGGSPQSVVRAAHYRMPLMLAIIGGSALRFAPYVELYHRALGQFGHERLPVGVHSPGHIAESDELAREQLWPHFRVNRDRIGRTRGWPPITREAYDHEVDEGALYVGSPETVARKMADTIRGLGLGRFDLKYSSGTMPHVQLMDSIGLYGGVVVPRVRELLATESAPVPA